LPLHGVKLALQQCVACDRASAEEAVQAPSPAVRAGEASLDRPVLDHDELPGLRVPSCRGLERQLDQALHQGVVDRVGCEAAERPAASALPPQAAV
jgi:hypothetical protein